ncbi:MAG: hypothetical protein KC441_10955 [Anaerolineales bacterium]|nr:hypothetical protein [Anaerolineales bacterium]
MTYVINNQGTEISYSANLIQETMAADRWESAYVRPWQYKLRELLGKEETLLNLSHLDNKCHLAARAPRGVQNVPINSIRGSVGRSDEFTTGFRPLKAHSRQRWIRVARAWQAGQGLPPVDLVQVGDTYFVMDGHHRISVAQAMGQDEIEASVITWTAVSAADQACVNEIL